MIKRNKKGFTLVELLVVMSIIAILASLIVTSTSSTRLKSRNLKRVFDLNQIKAALEIYHNNNGVYPDTLVTGVPQWRGECAAYGGYAPSLIITGLVPTYIPTFPADPMMNKPGSTSCYLYKSNGVDYALLDHAISDTGFSYASQPTLLDPTRDGGVSACAVDATGYWSWKIATPGAACW